MTTVAVYRYDALGRRIEFINSPPGGTATTTRYYYDGQNAISEYNQSGDIQRTYVHGSQSRRAGIDERAVMRRHDAAPEDHYYLLEELYTVAGLADSRGWLEEADVYDTYGDAEIWEWPLGDLNLDGQRDTADRSLCGGLEGSGDPYGDANLDGQVTSNDPPLIQDGGTPVETTYSSLANPYFFTGRTTDTLHASNLLVSVDPNYRRTQDNRNRTYDPKHGRWLQRDPLGMWPSRNGILAMRRQYADGMVLYQYVRSNPNGFLDPLGQAIACSYYGEWSPPLTVKSANGTFTSCRYNPRICPGWRIGVTCLDCNGSAWGRIAGEYEMHWILQGDIFGFPFEKEIAIGIPIDLSVFFTFTVALGVQPKVCMPFNLGLMAGQGGMWAWIIADRYYPLIDQIRGKADAVGQKLCDVIETLQTDQKPPCPEGTVRCGDSCMDQETYEKMMQLCAIPGIGCPCND